MVNPEATSQSGSQLAHVREGALEATDIAFTITDAAHPERPLVWANDAFERISGYTVAELVGQSLGILAGPDTDVRSTRRLREMMDAGESGTVTMLTYRKDGTPFWNQITISPMHDDGGRHTHWVSVQLDVTEQVERNEHQLRQVEEERRARSGLSVLSQLSDLVMDLEAPSDLDAIVRLLERTVVQTARFALFSREQPTFSGPPDPVRNLLDGATSGPVLIDPNSEHAPGSGAAWVRELLARDATVLDRSGTVAVAALTGRRRVLGALVAVLHDEGTGPYGSVEGLATIIELTGHRVGIALDVMRLYSREHRLAETLQRAMLPEPADVPDLDVWTYYAPSAGHAQVGGDWYDVLPIDDGVVGVVVGDVVGHDVEAAAAMGQLRSVVRSYAFEDTGPDVVLERVDQLVAGMGMPRAASLVLGMLRRDGDGAWTFEYSSAGHLPTMHVRDGHATTLDGTKGTLVGFDAGERTAARVELHPGDVLVLYTDGLVERRRRPLREGIDGLLEAGSQLTTRDAAGIGEELLARAGTNRDDDVAVVVVRVPDPTRDGAAEADAPRRRQWVFPGEPASIGRARHAVVRSAELWGRPDWAGAELVTSELVANAVLHSWGHVTLRLLDADDGLRIEVEDNNATPPVTTDGHPGRVGGYGMQIIERLADWGWRPTSNGKLVWAKVRDGDEPAEAGPSDDDGAPAAGLAAAAEE